MIMEGVCEISFLECIYPVCVCVCVCVYVCVQACVCVCMNVCISNGTHAVNGHASVSGTEDPHDEGNSACVCVCVCVCVCAWQFNPVAGWLAMASYECIHLL